MVGFLFNDFIGRTFAELYNLAVQSPRLDGYAGDWSGGFVANLACICTVRSQNDSPLGHRHMCISADRAVESD